MTHLHFYEEEMDENNFEIKIRIYWIIILPFIYIILLKEYRKEKTRRKQIIAIKFVSVKHLFPYRR